MEPNGTNQNRNMSTVVLCRMGCGFYGSVACDGMCSKCYKDIVKSRDDGPSSRSVAAQTALAAQSTTGLNLGRDDLDKLQMSLSGGSENSAADTLAADVCAAMSLASLSSNNLGGTNNSGVSNYLSPDFAVSGAMDVCESDRPHPIDAVGMACDGAEHTSDACQPTTTPRLLTACASSGSLSDASSTTSSSSSCKSKPTRNRCHTCSKKVGLTGFQCRCGGLYCSIHRYSDTHGCSFDYRGLAQDDIRKNNPVVVSEKVKKI